MNLEAKSTIESGKAILGIEFGSTRIKAVLIDQDNRPIAQGSHTWENQLVDGLWTYSVEAIWYGLQDCYANLRNNVKELYDTEIETLAAIGVSAMMHGYMAFNEKEAKLPQPTDCIKCGRCINHCPLNLDPVGFARARELDIPEELERLKANLCMECGVCAFVCPAKRPIVQNNRLAKAMLRKYQDQKKGENK